MNGAPEARAGIGLRFPHIDAIAIEGPAVAFLEVHAENCMSDSPAVEAIERLRDRYRFSVHGVGLSLGSADGVDRDHLQRLARVIDRLRPALVSEHLAWTGAAGICLNDLLPLPYTEESLKVAARNVALMQDFLGRRILIENPSAYLRFTHSTMEEAEFLSALVAETDCGLLCDLNNIFVTCHNTGDDPLDWLAAIPAEAVGEIHLAGHARNEADGATVLIDDHGSRVSAPVWSLYAKTVERFGRRPTLIEWDTDIPPLSVLVEEADRADRIAQTAGRQHMTGATHVGAAAIA